MSRETTQEIGGAAVIDELLSGEEYLENLKNSRAVYMYGVVVPSGREDLQDDLRPLIGKY